MSEREVLVQIKRGLLREVARVDRRIAELDAATVPPNIILPPGWKYVPSDQFLSRIAVAVD
jgi:hypothetical protein